VNDVILRGCLTLHCIYCRFGTIQHAKLTFLSLACTFGEMNVDMRLMQQERINYSACHYVELTTFFVSSVAELASNTVKA